MQGWCHPCCQTANFNTIHCIAEIKCCYQICQRVKTNHLWCKDGCQKANTIHCFEEIMLLPNLPKSKYHPLRLRNDAITKSVKKPIPSNVRQGWCYPWCQRANFNTIHCAAEIMLLPNLSKSQYHPLWCRDDVILAAKQQILIPSIVLQR